MANHQAKLSTKPKFWTNGLPIRRSFVINASFLGIFELFKPAKTHKLGKKVVIDFQESALSLQDGAFTISESCDSENLTGPLQS